MNNKILVIFLFAIIFSVIIYNITNNHKEKVAFIGENTLITRELLSNIDGYDIKTFTYDNITYKQLINNIKNNDYYIEKNNKVYLNRLIHNSDYIVIVANNIEYNKKCNRINNYENKINQNLDNLIDLIKRISDSKVILIQNYCYKSNIYNDYKNKNVISIRYLNNDKIALQISEVLAK